MAVKKREWIPQSDKTEEMKINEEKIPFFATKKGRGISAFLMVIVVATVMALSISKNSGAITYQMDGKMLGITCMDRQPLFIDYEDIAQIELITTFEMGEGIDTAEWNGGWCGTYENEAYGIYTLLAYSSANEYIVVYYKDGVLVFNCKNVKTTRSVCEKLKEKCGFK